MPDPKRKKAKPLRMWALARSGAKICGWSLATHRSDLASRFPKTRLATIKRAGYRIVRVLVTEE